MSLNILLKPYQVILGSQSPRRSELLTKGDIPFIKQLREVEEIFPEDLNAHDVPEYLANLKAKAFDGFLLSNQILICADTIVIQDDKVIGKPKDREHAVQTLRTLSNTWHTVVSGVCFKTNSETHSFSQISQVKFYELSNDEIDFYIDQYKPFDKAGSYGIQDWIGVNKIREIQGSYTNIMGLPMGKLYDELTRFIMKINDGH